MLGGRRGADCTEPGVAGGGEQAGGEGGDEVGGYLHPGQLAGRRERERHRGVDVAAGDVPNRVHHGDDHHHEGERDDAELRHRELHTGGLGDHERGGGGTRTAQHQRGGTDKLGRQLTRKGYFSHKIRPRLPGERRGPHLLGGGSWRDGVRLYRTGFRRVSVRVKHVSIGTGKVDRRCHALSCPARRTEGDGAATRRGGGY